MENKVSEKIIKETIMLLNITYPNHLKGFSEDETKLMIKVWFSDFNKVDEITFKKAIEIIRNRNNFFPSIAEIKKEITLLETPMLNDNAESEWEKVIGLIRSYKGQHDHLNALNPISRSIVKTFNFDNLCDMTSEELKWKRRDFIELYEINKTNGMTNPKLFIGSEISLNDLTRLAELNQDTSNMDDEKIKEILEEK